MLPTPEMFNDPTTNDSWISQLFAQARPTPDASVLNSLQQAQGSLDQTYQPMQVPGEVNPFAAMGGTFASTLAGMLGAHGAPAAFQQQLETASTAHTSAQEHNRDLLHQKQQARLELMLKIGEAKQKMSEQQSDYDLAEKQAKMNFGTQVRLQKMIEDRQAQRDQAALSRELAVTSARGTQSRLTNAARQTFVNRYGQDPKAKLVLQQADDQAALINSQYNEMLKANSTARSTYQEIPYSEAELETARLDANSKMSSLYQGAFDQMAKLGVTPNETPPAKTRPPISRFDPPLSSSEKK